MIVRLSLFISCTRLLLLLFAGCVHGSGLPSCLTFDAEAAGVQRGALCSGDVDLQTQLLQRPAVSLGHILAGGGNVRLWHKQAADTHVDVLDTEREKKKKG